MEAKSIKGSCNHFHTKKSRGPSDDSDVHHLKPKVPSGALTTPARPVKTAHRTVIFTALYSTALYYTALWGSLHYTALHYITLHSRVHCTILHCTILHYTLGFIGIVYHCTILRCTLLFTALCYTIYLVIYLYTNKQMLVRMHVST